MARAAAEPDEANVYLAIGHVLPCRFITQQTDRGSLKSCGNAWKQAKKKTRNNPGFGTSLNSNTRCHARQQV
jgi:hypothetical protein